MKAKTSLILLVLALFISSAWADDPNDANAVAPIDALIAMLPFDGDVLDVFGNVNEPNLLGDPNFAEGVFSQALVLDGQGQHVDLGADFGNGVMKGLASFSSTAWVKPVAGGMGDFPRLWQIGANNDQYIALLPITGGTADAPLHGALGGPRFEFKYKKHPDGLGNNITINGPNAVAFDEWNHLAAILDADANTASIYVNGELIVDNNNVPRTPSMIEEYAVAQIGAPDPSKATNNFFAGSIDNLAFYNYALSAEEIAAAVKVPTALFADSFDREDNHDVDASQEGMSGALLADLDPNIIIESFEGSGQPESTQILGGLLQMATGPGMGSAYIKHNFIDEDILTTGGMTISLDVVMIDSATSDIMNRFGGFGLGMTEAEAINSGDIGNTKTNLTMAHAKSNKPTEGVADFFVSLALDGIIRVWNNSEVVASVEIGKVAGNLSVDFAITDFAAGSEVSYAVSFDGVAVPQLNGIFALDHDQANYVGISCRASNDVQVDNLMIGL